MQKDRLFLLLILVIIYIAIICNITASNGEQVSIQ